MFWNYLNLLWNSLKKPFHLLPSVPLLLTEVYATDCPSQWNCFFWRASQWTLPGWTLFTSVWTLQCLLHVLTALAPAAPLGSRGSAWRWFWGLPQEVQQRSTDVFMNLWLHLPTVALWFLSPVALRLPHRLLRLLGKGCLIPLMWRWVEVEGV